MDVNNVVTPVKRSWHKLIRYALRPKENKVYVEEMIKGKKYYGAYRKTVKD